MQISVPTTYETKDDDTQEADGLLMYEVVYLNERNIKPQEFESGINRERIWYLDNGVSNHMTGNRTYFKELMTQSRGRYLFGMIPGLISKEKGTYCL